MFSLAERKINRLPSILQKKRDASYQMEEWLIMYIALHFTGGY